MGGIDLKRNIFIILILILCLALPLEAKTLKIKISNVEGKIITIPAGSQDGVEKNKAGKVFHSIITGGKNIPIPIAKIVTTNVDTTATEAKIIEIAQGWKVTTEDLVELEVSEKPIVEEPPIIEETPSAEKTPEVSKPQPEATPQPTETPHRTPAPSTLPEIAKAVSSPPSKGFLTAGEDLPAGSGFCTLKVTSSPDQAQVFADHRLIGNTPITLEKLNPGKHHLRIVSPPDYAPCIEEIELGADKIWNYEVKLEFSTQAYFRKGKEAFENGDLEAATQYFLPAAQYLPVIPEAIYYLGAIQYQGNNLDKALDLFRAYAFYQPNVIQNRLFMGRIYERQRRFNEAVTNYKYAVLLMPECMSALESPPAFTTESLYNLQNQVKNSPSKMDLRLQLAYIYEQRGSIKEALSQLKYIIKNYLKTHTLEGMPGFSLGD
jgi:hypothetical protein